MLDCGSQECGRHEIGDLKTIVIMFVLARYERKAITSSRESYALGLGTENAEAGPIICHFWFDCQ